MNNRTIERIRRRFIGVAMLAIFLAMIFLGGTIWLASLIVSRRAVTTSLDLLIESDELMSDVDFVDYYIDDLSIGEVFTANFRDQTDYLVVKYDNEGNLISIDGRYSKSAKGYFIEMSDEILQGKPGYGQRGRIWYKYVQTDDGAAIAFVDSTFEVFALRRLALITLTVCIAGLGITYILVVHFSDAIVASEVETFNKQQDFITNASHELKTPLSVIRANTEMSQMINGEDEWSVSTLKQVDHMNGLISNLVMISKAQELEDKTVMSEVDATSIVESSVKPFESVAAKEKITLTEELAPSVKMTADASKIMQLTTILVDNAIKYCDEEGTVKVELAQIRKGALRLTVTNTYKEGANVDYNKFFERFYREDKSHNIDKGGYGIGLSIAENICRQYNGSIKAVWKNNEISFICQLY